MAMAGLKLASEGGLVNNCFPARYRFGHTSSDASGAWVLARDDEQKRRFQAVLCAKHRTYSQIKEHRKKSEKRALAAGTSQDMTQETGGDSCHVLDKHFLMKHSCVHDPGDLCAVNISSLELTDVNEDDLALFKNVAYMNAGENFLPFEAFRYFPSLRELEVPLNGLRNVNISHGDFTNLEVLDISYNNLSQDDLLNLGLLASLKVLHLTGNHFSSLPPDLAMPYLSREKQVRLQRFACLEVLLLDDNKLQDMAVFAALAGLPRLRHLDLSRNQLFFVPQLKVMEGRVVTQDGTDRKRPRQRSGSRCKSGRSKNSHCLGDPFKVPVNEGEIDRKRSAVMKSGSEEELLEKVKVVTQEGNERQDNEGQDNAGQDNERQDNERMDNERQDNEGQDNERQDNERQDNERQGNKRQENEGQDSESQDNAEQMTENFGTGDLSARIHNFVSESEESQEKTTTTNLLPFPELRYLNLSQNKVYEESGLLALVAFPRLKEVDIFDNPLTTDKTGNPPLLKRFLQEQLGITVNRLKPQHVSSHFKKPTTQIHPKYVKITEVVPKVPKMSADDKLMWQLLASDNPEAIEFDSSALRKTLAAASNKKPVLPPIAAVSVCEEVTETGREMAAAPARDGGLIEGEFSPGQHEPDPFFMTQVNDNDENRSSYVANTNHAGASSKEGGAGEKSATDVDDRYKGYELLLGIEDLKNEPVLPPAKDIQGNIRALRQALNHLLVYRDPSVQLNKVHRMVQEYRRVPVPPARPDQDQSYPQKVNRVLSHLRTRSTLEEENLSEVLKDKGKLQRKFPEAKHLLAQVESRYNTIRNHLVADAKQAGNIAAQVLELLPSVEVKTST